MLGVCHHTVVVAVNSGVLKEHIALVRKSLNKDSVVSSGAPKQVGKKGNVTATTIEFKKHVPLPKQLIKATIVQLSEFRATKCFGCSLPLRSSDGTIPAHPNDLVMKTFEFRSYPSPGKPSYRKATQGNAFYHYGWECLRIRHPEISAPSVSIHKGVVVEARYSMI